MKTSMTPSFVTTQTFNRTMKSIHHRFEEVIKRLDFIYKDMDDQKVETRRVDTNSAERFNIFMEHVNESYKAIMEHPVFTNYKA
ncbi:MAG: hypothetical protein WCG97_02130 [bacterium]